MRIKRSPAGRATFARFAGSGHRFDEAARERRDLRSRALRRARIERRQTGMTPLAWVLKARARSAQALCSNQRERPSKRWRRRWGSDLRRRCARIFTGWSASIQLPIGARWEEQRGCRTVRAADSTADGASSAAADLSSEFRNIQPDHSGQRNGLPQEGLARDLTPFSQVLEHSIDRPGRCQTTGSAHRLRIAAKDSQIARQAPAKSLRGTSFA